MWEPQLLGTLWACPGMYRDYFAFTFSPGDRGSTVVKALFYTNRKAAGSIPDGVIAIFH